MILKSKSSSKESCILSLFHLKAETKNLNLHLQDSFIFNLLKSHIFLFLLLLPLLPISPSIQVSLSLSLSQVWFVDRKRNDGGGLYGMRRGKVGFFFNENGTGSSMVLYSLMGSVEGILVIAWCWGYFGILVMWSLIKITII